ncbi:MAG: hypothetical protein AAF490_31685 [Chloroflexota bacterium]
MQKLGFKRNLWFGFAIWLILVGCTAVSEPTPTPAPPTVTAVPTPEPTVIPSGLYVDALAPIGEINPLVYGTNYGPWLFINIDIQEEFEASGLTFFRFPGGRYGDSNNVRPLQIDQLMDLAETIDAEVTISVRMLGGTPEAAAELVRYTNIEKEYNVRYWSIGNEPSLYIDLQGEEEWDTAFYNEQWRIFAEAMEAVDPSIELIGPNIHQFLADEDARPKDPSGHDWLREFLIANGDMVDVVSIHRYPFPLSRVDPLPEIEDLRQNSREWDDIIPALRQEIRDITGRDMPIGVMEINSNWSNASLGEATPDSYYNAIWWGDVLGRMINQEVDMVTHFALQHPTAGWGMFGRTEPRPTYYVYRLYQHMGDELLFSETDDDLVSVVAARRDDGALTVMLINLGDDALTKPLTIRGLEGTTAVSTYRLAPDQFAEEIGETDISSGVELLGQSMTLLIFDN